MFFTIERIVVKTLKSWLYMPLLFCLVLGQAFAASPTALAASNPSSCQADADVINQNFGTKIPVILVHGLKGSPSQWTTDGGSSIYDQINNREDVAVALNFEYTDFYVNRDADADRLARDIDCAARISVENGGHGKVILIGYSLGAVISQIALNRQDYEGKLTSSKVGQFITIANGNEWDPMAPSVPTGVVTHAIAGDIINAYVDNGVAVTESDTAFDGLVHVANALSQHSGDFSSGGGTTTVSCYRQYTDSQYTTEVNPGIKPICEHGELLKNYTVQTDIQTAMTNYIAAYYTQRPWPAGGAVTNLSLGSINLSFDANWTLPDMGTGGPGHGANDDDGMASENLFTGRSLYIHHYTSRWECPSQDVRQCESMLHRNTVTQDGPASPITIDGITSDISMNFTEYYSPYSQKILRKGVIWCFSNKVTCLTYYQVGESGITGSYTPALISVLQHATWLN